MIMQGSIGVGKIRPGEMHLKPVLIGDASKELTLTLDMVADINHEAIQEFSAFLKDFTKRHNIDLVFFASEP